MAGYGVQAVGEVGAILQEMLDKALVVKQTNAIEPPLHKSDLAELFDRIELVFAGLPSPESKKAIIDTAVRDTFNNLLASTNIEEPASVKLWNLLDIVSILADDEQSEPGLLFWLVEELLDSQTIAGCRKIFDFLESRRERITAKHFSSKNLVILRSCNELLRRLSRAEDTAFCGRVFIFMFSSFPLGDRSSVNLRGEFHTENVTAFDVLPPKESDTETMDVDQTPDTKSNSTPTLSKGVSNGVAKKSADESSNASKVVSFLKPGKPLDADELYPIFWSLQRSLSQPKNLFDAVKLADFRAGVEATMVMFKSVQTESSGRSSKTTEEPKRGIKRKRGQGDDDLANTFNPKYLTSRDLFELEISDLSFRRHILVQVLIVLDFLLSLSVKAKEKLAKTPLPANPNKSVMYADQVVSEEDSQWALDMKKTIAEYLKQGNEGPFFYRMVETVLSRDKNWARWKIDNCPTIAKDAVTPQEYADAKRLARKTTTSKKFNKKVPLGSFKLDFLSEGNTRGGLDRLKDPARYRLPEIGQFKGKIADDEFEIDLAKDDESKNIAIESKASKSWRALRIASMTKLASFDKIDASEKIDEVFHDQIKPEELIVNGEDDAVDDDEVLFPTDRRPIVISGPSGVGKGTLVKMLLEKHPKALGRKASHTTRPPREGEVHGVHYFFVTKDEYDVMRDGDQFTEYNNYNGNDYGTSKKVIEGIIAKGKVPLMEMDYHGIQQQKDNGYPGRYIFLAPPQKAELEARLRKRGLDSEDKIQERLAIADKELEQSKVEGFHDKIIINDDLERAYKELEEYIFGLGEAKVEETTSLEASKLTDNGTKVIPVIGSTEVEMMDGETSTVGGAAKDEPIAI